MTEVIASEFRVPRLPAAIPCSGVSAAARQALRQFLGDADRELASAFWAGASVAKLVADRAHVMDNFITHVWNAWVGESDQVALFAVGGYGRGEMFPYSDVDLLVLHEQATAPALLRRIEAFFTTLWDMGLKLGHSVCTPSQCFDVAQNDINFYTGLLEARRISGGGNLESRLQQILLSSDLWRKKTYFESKVAEQQGRYTRFNNTAHNLEPNIKDGPGGLRSIQMMLWMGRRLYDARALGDLVQNDLLDAQEFAALEIARRELWRIRYGLHLVAARAEDRLLFDFQRELADRFGYRDLHKQNLGVEQFMQAYFRAAAVVERLNAQVLQQCEESLDHGKRQRLQISLDFSSVDGRLDSDAPDLLNQRPAALIELFRVWGQHPELKGLRSTLARRIHAALQEHAAKLSQSNEVNAAFLRLLRSDAIAVEALARMHRYGVLAHYLPAFGHVVGRMQYDLFHVYTVDEHAVRVLRFIAHFASPEGKNEFSLAHEIKARLAKPELLLLAALFHDIAKGRGGDHSQLGEQEARAFCEQLGLIEADTELVAWLVRWHLLMSVTAQRHDITDPDVVHRFAVQVADWERLDYLYLLTVADIAGTSPKLWNSWKDRLLSDLYTAARYVLRRGLERPPHVEQRVLECQHQALKLLADADLPKERAEHLWVDFPVESFLRYRPEQIAWQTKAIASTSSEQLPLVAVKADGVRGCTEVFVYARDSDGLFAAVTAALDRLRLNVQEARVVNSNAGFSLDTFLVLNSQAKPLEPGLKQTVVQTLRKALAKAPLQQTARRTFPRDLRHFHIPARIEFSQNPANSRTQVALICSDRPGLLAAVAQAFHNSGVRVHDARIATFGERVEDFFQITDQSNQPLLDEALLERLRTALLERIHAQLNESPRAGAKIRNNHVAT